MALLTDVQKSARKNGRTWVKPLYVIHPDANAPKFATNKFIFEETEYDNLTLAAIDKRFKYITPSDDPKVKKDITVLYTDEAIDDNPVYNELAAKHGTKGEDAVKFVNEYLVFIAELDEFAVVDVKTYAKNLVKAFEDDSVENPGLLIKVTPNIHKPEKAKFNSKLYLWEVEVTDELVDLNEKEGLENEIKIFTQVDEQV